MIIDASYFTQGELLIPNAVDLNANSSVNNIVSTLDSLIIKYERQLLLDALGSVNYNELVLELEKLPFKEDTEPPTLETAGQKWIDLVNGATYTYEDETYIWDGLKSMIPYYIYCMYLRSDEVEYSTTGMARNAVTNADRSPYILKYVTSWSCFLELNQGESDVTVSLVTYMGHKKDDFSTPKLKLYPKVNRFGI